MVHSFIVEQRTKIKKAIPAIENRMPVKIAYANGRVALKGSEPVEFVAEEVLRAVDFGFEVEDALLLNNPDNVLEFINIKEHTVKKNLDEVRSRVIGTAGKAKRTIENLTGSIIVVHGNRVGIIASAERLDATIQAIISLIRGAKHANVFAYLEKQNARLKELDEEDLGLKIKP